MRLRNYFLFFFLVWNVDFIFSQNITTYAGNGIYGIGIDNIPALNSSLAAPYQIAADAAGNLYIADNDNHRIRKVSPTGLITNVAGQGTSGFGGDGGPATSAFLNEPSGVAVDNAGNIYIADYGNCRIRKVNTSGIISTIAGSGQVGFGGDGGSALLAKFWWPTAVAVDGSGNVYVADWANSRIRVIYPSGIINTFAGNGSITFSGDGGPANVAGLHYPQDVCTDAAGNVYIADYYNKRVRKVNTSGIITTIAGNPSVFTYTNGAPALSVGIPDVVAINVDNFGNLYIVSDASVIYKVNTAGNIFNFVGPWFPDGFAGDGGPAIAAKCKNPQSITSDLLGNIFISDRDNNRIRVICAPPAQPGLINGSTNLCNGSTSIFSVVPSVGASSYSWTLPGGWTGTSNTNTISITNNGTVGTLSVVAINPCGEISIQSTIAINIQPPPSLTIIPSSSISCSNEVVSLSVTGANSYSWSTGSFSANISVSPSTTSTYSVVGSDLFGCTNSSAITLSVLPLPSINISAVSQTLCSGQTATLVANGASTYTWTPIISNSASLSISPFLSSNYTVTGTGGNGCINSSQVSMSVTPTPTLISTPFQYICSGNATLTATGANTYTWMPVMISGNNIYVNPTTTTQYTLIGANETCTSSALSTVSVGVSPPLIITSDKQSGCPGACFSFSTSSSDFSPFTFSWGDSTITNPSITQHCFSASGIYTISVAATYSTGCTVIGSNSIQITINASPIPNMNVIGGNNQPVNSPITFNNQSTGADQFIWDFGDSTALVYTSSVLDISHTFSVPAKYCTKLIASNSNTGCKDSILNCIEILCVSQIEKPNFFSPNQDDVNDVFKFRNKCITTLSCSIFDRWGLKIYDWSGSNGGWDGRTYSGQPVTEGVYFYTLTYLNSDKEIITDSGSIQLFK